MVNLWPDWKFDSRERVWMRAYVALDISFCHISNERRRRIWKKERKYCYIDKNKLLNRKIVGWSVFHFNVHFGIFFNFFFLFLFQIECCHIFSVFLVAGCFNLNFIETFFLILFLFYGETCSLFCDRFFPILWSLSEFILEKKWPQNLTFYYFFCSLK